LRVSPQHPFFLLDNVYGHHVKRRSTDAITPRPLSCRKRDNVPAARTSKFSFLVANFKCKTSNERVTGAFCGAVILMTGQISRELTLHFANVLFSYSAATRVLFRSASIEIKNASMRLHFEDPLCVRCFLIIDHPHSLLLIQN